MNVMLIDRQAIPLRDNVILCVKHVHENRQRLKPQILCAPVGGQADIFARRDDRFPVIIPDEVDPITKRDR